MRETFCAACDTTCDSWGLIIWTLLSQQYVVATTTKPRLGHLAPASEVAGRHTLPFKKGHGLPILKWYGMSSEDL
jgi:hypothetical protein